MQGKHRTVEHVHAALCHRATYHGGLFTMTVLPTGAVHGAVLACPSVFRDLGANYRREVLVARSLARVGIVVQRFHYQGTGNSLGDELDLSITSMLDDARTAVDLLAEQIGDVPIGFLGTRLGGFIAATLAGETPGAPLVLWDPLPTGSAYVTEATRAARITAVAAGTADVGAVGGPDRTVEVMGWVIPPDLAVEAKAIRLADLRPTGDVLVAEFAPVGRGLSLAARSATELEGQGLAVELARFPEEGAWWFADELSDELDIVEGAAWPLVDRTRDFFRGALHRVGATRSS